MSVERPTGRELNVLALRACDGDEVAFAALCRAMAGAMWNVVDGFYGPGLEREDLMQEARIALLQATRSFDGVRPFASLAVTVMTRRVLDAVKASRTGKHRVLNSADPLDVPLGMEGRGATRAEVTGGGVEPATCLEQAEDVHAVLTVVASLGGLERRMALAMLNTDGLRHAAEACGVSHKAADNAVQRIRAKIRVALEAA